MTQIVERNRSKFNLYPLWKDGIIKLNNSKSMHCSVIVASDIFVKVCGNKRSESKLKKRIDQFIIKFQNELSCDIIVKMCASLLIYKGINQRNVNNNFHFSSSLHYQLDKCININARSFVQFILIIHIN